jgi:ATP-dependent RNA helicase DHX57
MKAIGCESDANILVTQPRRVAATSLAMRVSNERLSPSPGKDGSVVGYNVRLSKAVSDTTKITYCTVGVLLRMLVASYKDDDNILPEADNDKADENPNIPLSDVSHVIIDEVHERDLNTDFALTLLKPLLLTNKNISIILMSATASAELFVNYFRISNLNIDPKVFQIPGRTFPVETKWLSDCERLLSKGLVGWKNDIVNHSGMTNHIGDDDTSVSLRATAKIDYQFIAQLIIFLARQQWESKGNESYPTKTNGAILIFLPGKGEIQSLRQLLLKDSSLRDKKKCSILQLHSSLSPQEQWLAFQPVMHGIVKLVLATNVAETSITIPDISIVIDTGRVKESQFNASTRIRELVTVWTSQASAKQRAGRAGRTGPGICYKLYSEEFCHGTMLPQTPPEIVRSPLEEIVLQVCLLKEQSGNGEGISPMKFLSMAPQPPSKKRLSEACDHLLQIGALTSMSGLDKSLFRLTPLGYHLSHLPMDANVGKILVIGCILKCIEPALTIAAALSCSKSCWLSYLPGVDDSRSIARQLQEKIVRDGFGGEAWSHGTVKGDLIGVIAAFNAWVTSGTNERERKQFANENALDSNALLEIKGLRSQFKDILTLSGLLVKTKHTKKSTGNNNDDALLTSCCLVAGLYPNISTLVRPSRENKITSGQLITKDGDSCVASSESFQVQRLKNAQEKGRDAYAVYHSKHRTVGTTYSSTASSKAHQRIFLSGINFVSRYSILLFGGEIEVNKNYILVDNWLKFKIAEDSNESGKKQSATQANAILIQELRNELDNVMLKCIISEESENERDKVVEIVRKLLAE